MLYLFVTLKRWCARYNGDEKSADKRVCRGGDKLVAMIREILEGIIRRIKSYDSKEDKLIDLWLQGDIPKLKSIDDALDADYRRNPDLWIDPSIVSWYTGKDLLDEADWEPGARGFMERFWWVGVVFFITAVIGGIVWGLLNRAGA